MMNPRIIALGWRCQPCCGGTGCRGKGEVARGTGGSHLPDARGQGEGAGAAPP